MVENKLTKLPRASITEKTAIEMGEPGPCREFGQKDYNDYIIGQMSLKQMESFISHCEQCPTCLNAVAEQHKKKIQKDEKWENELLFSQTLHLLDSLDGKKNLLDIVIKASRNLFELLSTSGDFLSVSNPIPVRGGDRNMKIQPLKIIKEFDAPPLSVQVVIEKEEQSVKVSITVSLYDPIQDDFLSGRPVTLSGLESKESSISNDTGEVFFELQQAGYYQFTIGDEEKPDAQLGIKILSE